MMITVAGTLVQITQQEKTYVNPYISNSKNSMYSSITKIFLFFPQNILFQHSIDKSHSLEICIVVFISSSIFDNSVYQSWKKEESYYANYDTSSWIHGKLSHVIVFWLKSYNEQLMAFYLVCLVTLPTYSLLHGHTQYIQHGWHI